MSRLVRKWLLCASPDGLSLRQAGAIDSSNAKVHIEYQSLKITSQSHPGETWSESSSLEIYGVVGILNLLSAAYLIVITRREQVAQIKSKAVYALRDVTLVPLTSQGDADKSIQAAAAAVKKQQTSNTDIDTDISDDEPDAASSSLGGEEKPSGATSTKPLKGTLDKSTSFAKDVIQDRGRYGLFAKKWFGKSDSKSTGSGDQSGSNEDTSAPVPPKEDGDDVPNDGKTVAAEPEEAQKGQTSAIESLNGRIQRTAKLYFSSSGFYFSYDLDFSKRLDQPTSSTSDVPMWKQFDPLYFGNKHLIQPFIDANRDELVLPLMQGFVGQRAVTIAPTTGDQTDLIEDATKKTVEQPPEPASKRSTDAPPGSDTKPQEFLLTLISRRSVKRAGLRYLRRGVDDDGNVANAVETEQILSSSKWDSSEKVFSLTQTRGSIPLHFTQSPYNFKPTPVIHGSEATNQAALKKHFASMSACYGEVEAVSLVNKHPPEDSIGQLYEDHVSKLNESRDARLKPIGFEWFDFHTECKGMKFENVSVLLSTLEKKLKAFSWAVQQNDRVVRKQSGVIRTNCMDCLDRSNVVQSAIAGWILEQQLGELGLRIDLKADPKTQWFNSLWADNGDAISRQYAGTAALKGDFTRTRKRNWTGALSDFSLTMGRYFRNTLGDYFLQTCIDFFLGNAGSTIFDDFETDMMAKDYALDMGRIRQNAIDTCVKLVVEDPKEGLIEGWALGCPQEANTLRSLPLEECVVLLTNEALYFCRFDWATDKLASFERAQLTAISEIWRGAYITNAFGTNLDETKNIGFALKYKPTEDVIVRRNTRTMQSDEDASDDKAGASDDQQKDSEKDQPRLLAFKILPAGPSSQEQSKEENSRTEMESVKQICEKIHDAMKAAHGVQHLDLGKTPSVEERPIISAADAKKNTGYVESIGYSLKKLVWS